MKKSRLKHHEVYSQKIGLLDRTLFLYYYDWGINAVAQDRTEGEIRYKYTSRNFNLCKTYPTLADCEQRAKKYFKIGNSSKGITPVTRGK